MPQTQSHRSTSAKTPAPQLASVFHSGNSQAVRLPKAFRVDSDKVEILRRGDELILRPYHPTLAAALSNLTPLPQADMEAMDDFMAELRNESLPEDARDWSLFDTTTAQAAEPKARYGHGKPKKSSSA
jgi:antitoxin VapB